MLLNNKISSKMTLHLIAPAVHIVRASRITFTTTLVCIKLINHTVAFIEITGGRVRFKELTVIAC